MKTYDQMMNIHMTLIPEDRMIAYIRRAAKEIWLNLNAMIEYGN